MSRIGISVTVTTAIWIAFTDKTIGLDGDRYDACMDSKRYAGRIEESYQEGIAIGVNSTPSLYVEGRKFEGQPTSDGLKALVDSLITRHKR